MNLLPIVLDIETSGIDKIRCGIWQIGAIDLNDTSKYFLQEGRIDDSDEIFNAGDKLVLEVIGKTEAQLRDKNKLSQKQLLENFFQWVEKRSAKNLLCQNPFFDVGFIDIKARKYELKIPFHYRSFDLHSFAQDRYYQLHGEFLINEGGLYSDMGLSNIIKFCGMEDNRKAHNALEDAKLTAECFSRLVYGKNLFPEFSKFPIPGVLRK